LTLSVDNIATDLISNYKNSNYEKDFYHTIGAGFCCTLFAEDFLAKEYRLRDTGFSFRTGGYDRWPVLVSGSSIQSLRQAQGDSSGSTAVNPSSTHNQNKGYDYHILKLDQQGQKVWEKYFSGNQHDYLSATVSTREGGFLLAGTSYSSLGLDKKDKSNGSSDIWLIKIDENGEEQWQKTIGTRYSEEARSVTQTTDEGYIVAGSTNHPKSGYGSKDVLVIKLDKKGRIISQLILGGKGLDEVEKVIPTKDGGVLMGIYSRSGAIGNDELSMINDKRSRISNSSTALNVKNGSGQKQRRCFGCAQHDKYSIRQ
jgi:hypothetical protein